jgi:outer membrane biosynthesis protein TonB
MATPNLVPKLAWADNDNGTPLGVIPTRSNLRAITEEIAASDGDEGGGGKGLALLLAVSIAAHVGLFAGIGHGGRPDVARAKRRPPAEVTVEVAPPKPAAAPPPETAPAPRAAPRRIAVRAAPAPKAPPPQAETPADFSGTTLTNDGPGPGWASAVGNGQAMHGPIGTPGAKVTGRAQDGVAGGPARGTEAPVVPLASLSRPPAPPDLNAALERHYPEAARRQGTPGEAVLKARVTPEGRVRDLVLVSESAPGFGDACRATLRESVWSAPLDASGRPVATFVTYTCRFEVR